MVNAPGDDIGRVIEVRNGTAHIDPDPGLDDTFVAKLGWGDKETYRLDSSHIETVTDDEIRLRD